MWSGTIKRDEVVSRYWRKYITFIPCRWRRGQSDSWRWHWQGTAGWFRSLFFSGRALMGWNDDTISFCWFEIGVLLNYGNPTTFCPKRFAQDRSRRQQSSNAGGVIATTQYAAVSSCCRFSAGFDFFWTVMLTLLFMCSRNSMLSIPFFTLAATIDALS